MDVQVGIGRCREDKWKSKIRITKAPWIAAVSARGQTIKVGVEVICTKASVATEVVKSAGCPFFSYFRSAQGSPALDWSESTKWTRGHHLLVRPSAPWATTVNVAKCYWTLVKLFSGCWVHHKIPKNYPCQGVRFWRWSECRGVATVCVIDSLKDTQLCQKYLYIICFYLFGFFSSHSDRCEF
jgi:hypothetical protein